MFTYSASCFSLRDLFLLTGSYNHQGIGNLRQLCIVSLESLPAFSDGCIRCVSVPQPPSKRLPLGKWNAFQMPWPLYFSEGQVLNGIDLVCRPKWSCASRQDLQEAQGCELEQQPQVTLVSCEHCLPRGNEATDCDAAISVPFFFSEQAVPQKCS